MSFHENQKNTMTNATSSFWAISLCSILTLHHHICFLTTFWQCLPCLPHAPKLLLEEERVDLLDMSPRNNWVGDLREKITAHWLFLWSFHKNQDNLVTVLKSKNNTMTGFCPFLEKRINKLNVLCPFSENQKNAHTIF